MKLYKLIFLFAFILLLFATVVSAQNQSSDDIVYVHIFHGQGCPHCSQAMDFLDSIQSDYPSLKVVDHEVYFDDSQRELFAQVSQAYDKEIGGVPTIFIGNKVFEGFSSSISVSLVQAIEDCVDSNECVDPLDQITSNNETTHVVGDSSPAQDPQETNAKNKLTLGAVIGAALVDAINPCAFAVLIILITSILGSQNRRRALFAGLAFSLAIFISYFLMGLGLYSVVAGATAAVFSSIFYIVVGSIAILIGLFNLKDFLWYGRWFVMEVPVKWRPKMKALIRGITSVPGAFGIGFVISLFLLPCTSGPYIVILGLLAKAATKQYALWMLLLYNLIFIIPMIAITIGTYLGITNIEKTERLRKRNLKRIHFVVGCIMIVLGIALIVLGV